MERLPVPGSLSLSMSRMTSHLASQSALETDR